MLIFGLIIIIIHANKVEKIGGPNAQIILHPNQSLLNFHADSESMISHKPHKLEEDACIIN